MYQVNKSIALVLLALNSLHHTPLHGTMPSLNTSSTTTSSTSSTISTSQTQKLTALQTAIKNRDWNTVRREGKLPVYQSDVTRNLILIIGTKGSGVHDKLMVDLALALYEHTSPIIVSGPIFQTYFNAHNNKKVQETIDKIKQKKGPYHLPCGDLIYERKLGEIDTTEELILGLIPCTSQQWYSYYNTLGNFVLLIPKDYVADQTTTHSAQACGFDEKNLTPLDLEKPAISDKNPDGDNLVAGLISMFETKTSYAKKHASALKKNTPPHWNIVWVGHGLPPIHTNGVFEAETSLIAGVIFSYFNAIIKFFNDKLLVDLLYMSPCFFDGYNKNFVLQTNSINFVLISQGASNIATHVRWLPSISTDITGNNSNDVTLHFFTSYDLFFTMVNTFFLNPQSFKLTTDELGLSQIDPYSAITISVADHQKQEFNAFLFIYDPQSSLCKHDRVIVSDGIISLSQKESAETDTINARDKDAIVVYSTKTNAPLIFGHDTVLISHVPVELTTKNGQVGLASTYEPVCTCNAITCTETPLWQVISNLIRFNVAYRQKFVIKNLVCSDATVTDLGDLKASTLKNLSASNVEISVVGTENICAYNSKNEYIYPGTVTISLCVDNKTYKAQWMLKDLHEVLKDAQGLTFVRI